MSAPCIISASLPSFCQKLSKLEEIWRSCDKNNFAQFFWDTVCMQNWIRYLVSVSDYNAVEFCRFKEQVVADSSAHGVMEVDSVWLVGVVDNRKHVYSVVRNPNFLGDDLPKRVVTTSSCQQIGCFHPAGGPWPRDKLFRRQAFPTIIIHSHHHHYHRKKKLGYRRDSARCEWCWF